MNFKNFDRRSLSEAAPAPEPEAEAEAAPEPEAEAESPAPEVEAEVEAESPSPEAEAEVEAESPSPEAEAEVEAESPSPEVEAESPSPEAEAEVEAESPAPEVEAESPAPEVEAESPSPEAEAESPAPEVEAESPAPEAESPSPEVEAEAESPTSETDSSPSQAPVSSSPCTPQLVNDITTCTITEGCDQETTEALQQNCFTTKCLAVNQAWMNNMNCLNCLNADRIYGAYTCTNGQIGTAPPSPEAESPSPEAESPSPTVSCDTNDQQIMQICEQNDMMTQKVGCVLSTACSNCMMSNMASGDYSSCYGVSFQGMQSPSPSDSDQGMESPSPVEFMSLADKAAANKAAQEQAAADKAAQEQAAAEQAAAEQPTPKCSSNDMIVFTKQTCIASMTNNPKAFYQGKVDGCSTSQSCNACILGSNDQSYDCFGDGEPKVKDSDFQEPPTDLDCETNDLITMATCDLSTEEKFKAVFKDQVSDCKLTKKCKGCMSVKEDDSMFMCYGVGQPNDGQTRAELDAKYNKNDKQNACGLDDVLLLHPCMPKLSNDTMNVLNGNIPECKFTSPCVTCMSNYLEESPQKCFGMPDEEESLDTDDYEDGEVDTEAIIDGKSEESIKKSKEALDEENKKREEELKTTIASTNTKGDTDSE